MPSKTALLVAETLLHSMERAPETQVELWHIVKMAEELKKLGVGIGPVSIYETAGRLHSDAVARIVSNFLQLGVVEQNSPIELTDEGSEALRSMLERASSNPETASYLKELRKNIPRVATHIFNPI